MSLKDNKTQHFEIIDHGVKEVFDKYEEPLKEKLLKLRELIFEVADKNKEIGPLEETLKWGQVSYLTSKTKSGTTIRIDRVKDNKGQYAMYVHCQTSLIETFKTIYPDKFHYEKNRAILLNINDKVPKTALRHCISLALTYHLSNKKQ